MDETQANNLGGEWGNAVESAWPWPDVEQTHERLMSVRFAMRFELARFLPDDVEHAIVALQDGDPGVIALAGDGLYRARGTYASANPVPRIEITRTSLEAASSTVSITTTLSSRHNAGWRDATWTFEIDGQPLEIVSETIVDVPRALSSEEALARALAQRLGWTLPGILTATSVA
jgi:hypothetical protein